MCPVVSVCVCWLQWVMQAHTLRCTYDCVFVYGCVSESCEVLMRTPGCLICTLCIKKGKRKVLSSLALDLLPVIRPGGVWLHFTLLLFLLHSVWFILIFTFISLLKSAQVETFLMLYVYLGFVGDWASESEMVFDWLTVLIIWFGQESQTAPCRVIQGHSVFSLTAEGFAARVMRLLMLPVSLRVTS